ncbi:MAG: imidazole glycerol phosphate synthase subunit HisH [Gammaproteobacteria bacterium]|nr:imidazole glycerol phosphate synthase subunit HisH [Gammaproteobacteria bacterium]MDH5801227.1 imidazole glycerol phosphate synthase subunit HisH [Gammaproteobacteria bacterium]
MNSVSVGVIDYGVGNIFSIVNALQALDCNVVVATKPHELVGIDRIVLPGVGAYPKGMKNLNSLGFSEHVKSHVDQGGLLLGICLGMQLALSEGYEDGRTSGLDLVQGNVVPLESSGKCRVPHMGWNNMEGFNGLEQTLFEGVELGSSFYFVHSYHSVVREDVQCSYVRFCNKNIVAAFQKKNVFGVQFHPEKSQKAGLKLLKNFVHLKNI